MGVVSAYESEVEVLEALGFDPAFGRREWIEGFHVQDLLALARGVYAAQRGAVSWREVELEEQRIEDMLFLEDLCELASELGIEEVSKHDTGALLEPSFLSYGVGIGYVLDKIVAFFEEVALEESQVAMTVTVKRFQDELHVELSAVEGYRRVTLLRVPCRYTYKDHGEVRFECVRLMQEALSVYTRSYLYEPRGGRSVRRLMWEGARFVEELWFPPLAPPPSRRVR